ncbi:MAG: alpha/beta hydrolase fold domain-containing protein [Acidimicrobiia bacterium]|nr:alpha/beta hydrolase fold domain-containing protein [Acidimicrobiia bacterium]NNC42682.1 alpha/beta hydrolase fold domain-containing protein [Acidimicrobiia bacterium]
MITALFFVVSFIAGMLTYNALRKRSLWLLALVIGEFPVHHFVLQVLVTVGFVAIGAVRGFLGWFALGQMIFSMLGLLVLTARALRSKGVVAGVLGDAGIELNGEVPHALADVILIQPRLPESIEEIGGLSYGPDQRHRLDLHRPRSPGGPLPMLVQIHGGGWRRGSRDTQGRPLVHHMAELGWLCASIDYRLSPAATFPDHLEDVKRAIGWLRENADSWGADPSYVAVTGGSAGGHLAALAALTIGEPHLQPGFESADTSVQACVPLYGIHDLLDRNRVRYPWPFVEATVMKVSPDRDPQAWDLASPLTRVTVGAPPFFVLHGSHDFLVPPLESRQFVAALSAVSDNQVLYAEIPGATHGFDARHSIRSRHVVHGVQSFLHHHYEMAGSR